MTRKKYTNLSIPEELIEEVDNFIKTGKRGFSSRAEVVKQALRDFIDKMKK